MRLFLLIAAVLIMSIIRADEDQTHVLAFVMTVDDVFILTVIDENGDNLQVIYTCDDICRDPKWSADGTRIGLVDGQTLIIVDAATGEVETSISVDMGTYDYSARPDWTDDLSRVVYAARVDMVNRLRVVDTASGEVNELTEIGSASWPQWRSTDILIYVAGGRIYETNLDDTSEPTALTDADTRYDLPILAPDATTIAARALDEPTGLAIIGDEVGLVYEGVIDSPMWSSDGTNIVLNTWDDGVVSLVAIAVDDADDPIVLAENSVLNYAPTWAPDGQTLAYLGIDADQPQFLSLYTVPADGSSDTTLLIATVRRAAGIPSSPAWRPHPEEPDDL